MANNEIDLGQPDDFEFDDEEDDRDEDDAWEDEDDYDSVEQDVVDIWNSSCVAGDRRVASVP